MRTIINLLLMLLLVISAENVLGRRLLNVTDKQQNEEQNASPEQQTPPDSQGQASSSAAIQSVTGCVVQSANGYSLKTDSDTYPIETDKDLSQYVNKQIKLTGILEHHTAPVPSAASSNAATITDLRLRMIASVVGDCPSSK
jgi:hypothetical protein